ncbi:MAG TPA: c-type cytochrome [Candidatus Acidoferrum sp.]|nr:c-type cytochrome [Candidatus Acidoferrum sp.]
MAHRIALFFLLSTLLIFGFLLRDARAQRSEAVQGVQRYIEFCAGCHGADAKGGDKGPPLISAAGIRNRTDAELFRIVHDGTKNGMPPFAQLGDANIRAILQFLKALGGNTASKSGAAEAAPTGDADSGRALYFGKAQCSQCHLINGKGGFIAGSLTGYGRNRGVDEILNAITNPDSPLLPSSQVVIVTTNSGQELTGVLRNEDNFNLEFQSEDGQFHFLARSDLKAVQYTEHSLMPRDYSTRLSPKELNDIVTFLIVSSKNPPAQKVESR